MIEILFRRVSALQQRARAMFQRVDPGAAEAAERRAKWKAAIAEHTRGQQPTAAPPADAGRK